ncbi:MAG: hypothetical protein A2X86_02000 [Bdellovibrionales bacterium GWA2_49_15]|nr:MAG: hypothetical protein A2X86_02000 [Bdellovibrionales bacterium GWA2_49_15]
MFLKSCYSLLLAFMLMGATVPSLGATDAQTTVQALESSAAWKKLNSHTKAIQNNILIHLITKSISNIESWGVDSVELGISDGLIAKVIFTVNRSVEKNDNSTGPADKFLVRDTLKIGMRLGFGYVVSGDVALIRQYSLIYPVATKREGAFHNKFIANLFLPYHVAKNKLPPKYVLLIEDSLEGRGRVNIGGLINFPVGLDTRLSAIHLHRTFYDAKDSDSMLIFDDQSRSTKVATELYAGLSSINLPMFNGSLESGELNRQYVRIPRTVLDKNTAAADSISLGMWENNLAGIKKFGTLRLLDDTFIEKYYRYTIFGLAYVEARNREDHFTETIPVPGQPDPGVYEHYQLYHDKTAKWMWPTSGEKKYKNVVLTGEPETTGEIKRASMLVSFRIQDLKTNQREIGPGYLHMIDTITREKNFLNFEYLGKNGHWGTTNLKFDVYFSEHNLKRLQTVSSEEIWKHVALVTAQPKMANLEGRRVLRKDLWKNRHLLRVAQNVRAFLKSLAKYQHKPKAVEQLRALSNAIKEITYLSESAYSPYGLAALVEILGKDTVYFFAHFSIPDDYLKELTTETVLERVRGPKPGANDVFHPFVFNNAHQIYYFF